ncbi:MAG: TolC family protein [Gammaproteobacteria bacterium]
MKYRARLSAGGRSTSAATRPCGLLALVCSLAVSTASDAREVTEHQALAAALARPELQVLESSRRQAMEAEIEQSVMLPNPVMALGREGFTTGGGGSIETSYELQQQIDLAGRRRLTRAAGMARLDAFDSAARGRREELVAQVRRGFADLLYRVRILAVLEEGQRRLAAVATVVERLAQTGDASGYDRRRVAREQSAHQVRVGTAGAELRRSRALLGGFLDEPDAQALEPVGALLPAPPPPFERLTAGLPQRPELTALQAQADASAGELRVAQRAWIPDVTLGIGNRVIDGEEGDNERVMLSLSLPLPVFDRGQPAARKAAAMHAAFQAEHALRAARLAAELDGAWQQASALARAARSFRRDSLADSRELTRIARAAYADGEGTILDLLDAYRTELDAALSSLELDFRAKLARIDLDQLAGVNPDE